MLVSVRLNPQVMVKACAAVYMRSPGSQRRWSALLQTDHTDIQKRLCSHEQPVSDEISVTSKHTLR